MHCHRARRRKKSSPSDSTYRSALINEGVSDPMSFYYENVMSGAKGSSARFLNFIYIGKRESSDLSRAYLYDWSRAGRI